jgi:hypothetical protein
MTFNDDRRASTLQADVSRRRLVKSAATRAWTVPAVQLATAVPAHATGSRGACDLDIKSASASFSRPKRATTGAFTVEVTIRNTGSVTAAKVSVTLKFSERYGDVTPGAAPSGWVRVDSYTAKGCTFITYTYAAPLPKNGVARGSFTATGKIEDKHEDKAILILTGGVQETGQGKGCSGDFKVVRVTESKDKRDDEDDD